MKSDELSRFVHGMVADNSLPVIHDAEILRLLTGDLEARLLALVSSAITRELSDDKLAELGIIAYHPSTTDKKIRQFINDTGVDVEYIVLTTILEFQKLYMAPDNQKQTTRDIATMLQWALENQVADEKQNLMRQDKNGAVRKIWHVASDTLLTTVRRRAYRETSLGQRSFVPPDWLKATLYDTAVSIDLRNDLRAAFNTDRLKQGGRETVEKAIMTLAAIKARVSYNDSGTKLVAYSNDSNAAYERYVLDRELAAAQLTLTGVFENGGAELIGRPGVAADELLKLCIDELIDLYEDYDKIKSHERVAIDTMVAEQDWRASVLGLDYANG